MYFLFFFFRSHHKYTFLSGVKVGARAQGASKVGVRRPPLLSMFPSLAQSIRRSVPRFHGRKQQQVPPARAPARTRLQPQLLPDRAWKTQVQKNQKALQWGASRRGGANRLTFLSRFAASPGGTRAPRRLCLCTDPKNLSGIDRSTGWSQRVISPPTLSLSLSVFHSPSTSLSPLIGNVRDPPRRPVTNTPDAV